MKNEIFLILGFFLIAACSTIRFGNPQPGETRELNKIPSKLIGNYLDADGDTLFVNKKSFIFKNDEEKKLSGDRVFLKKYKDFYVLSVKEVLHGNKKTDLEGWDVILVKLSEDNSLVCYSINTSTDEKEQVALTKLKDIIFVEKQYHENNKDRAYFVINPSKKQFEEIINSNIFSVVMEFKRIEKLPL